MLRHLLCRRAGATVRNYSSINCNTHYNVVFVRHGQSTWNRDNRFIGWTDTPLTGTPDFKIGDIVLVVLTVFRSVFVDGLQTKECLKLVLRGECCRVLVFFSTRPTQVC